MWWVVTWTFGSLFSGIGGLDLGLQRAGWECRWQVEIDPFCRRVLDKHWPAVPKYEDVKQLDPTDLEPVELICGGFPCQPVSRAGRRMAQADDRWLWPEFARVVRGVGPRFVLVENVPGLLAHGMGDVLGELATLGYDAEWESIPAASVGALHIRDRVFIVGDRTTSAQGRTGEQRRVVADAASDRQRVDQDNQDGPSEREVVPVSVGSGPYVADSRRGRGEPRSGQRWPPGRPQSDDGRAVDDTGSGRHRASQGPLFPRGRSPQLSSWWEIEPGVGRVADGVPGGVDRLRGLGNAVVPQVTEWIGRRLMEVA